MCESRLKQINYVFICFVDYENAFDRVDLEKLLCILKEIDVDWRDRRLILNLYIQQTAVVKVLQENSEERAMWDEESLCQGIFEEKIDNCTIQQKRLSGVDFSILKKGSPAWTFSFKKGSPVWPFSF